MRQFDVYPNPSARSQAVIPYVVVLQSHFFEGVPTTIVAPLLVDDERSAYSKASVTVEFRSSTYVVSIPELVALDRSLLRNLAGDLRRYEDDIRRALERVFAGF